MIEAEKIQKLEETIKLYEQNGAAKLYYSLQRKMNEMADLMNNTILTKIAIDDPKDKTFDRLKVIWGDAGGIAQAVEALGKLAKVTGDMESDINKKPFNDRIAMDRD